MEEAKETVESPEEQKKINLTPEVALNTIIKALEDTCRSSYNLQEAELANRAVRFFKKQKQMTEEFEKEIDEKKALEITLHCLNVGQKAKMFNLDESSLLLYSLSLISEKK